MSKTTFSPRVNAIFYFIFNNISQLGNSIFLYYIAFLLLKRENGGMLCSAVLGIDAFFEVMVGPLIAKFIDLIPELKKRLQNSLVIQLILAILTFVFAFFSPKEPLLMFLPLIIIRFLILIDNQLKAALPLYLDKQRIVPLMRSLSITLFSQRCILLLSSTFALAFLDWSWLSSCMLNALTYLAAIFALILILGIIKPWNSEEKGSLHRVDERPLLSEVQKKKWFYWNCSIVFLSGLAFGSVTLILTKYMLLSTELSFFEKIIRGPAPIYAGVFVSIILMMFWPIKIQPYVKSAKRICVIGFFLATLLILVSFSPLYLRLPLLFFLGIMNGVCLVGGDAFFQSKMEGTDFIKVVAKSQAFGKAGILLSLAGMGVYIDYHFKSLELLAFCGICGVLFYIFLFLQAFALENSSSPIKE